MKIRWTAVINSLLLAYIIPFVVIQGFLSQLIDFDRGTSSGVLNTPLVYLALWYLFPAPLLAGYRVARLAETQPLYHGLYTGAFAGVLLLAIFSGNALFTGLLIAAATLAITVFGAHLARDRSQGPT